MGPTNGFIDANFSLGQTNLFNPDYVIERWHTVLVACFYNVSGNFHQPFRFQAI